MHDKTNADDTNAREVNPLTLATLSTEHITLHERPKCQLHELVFDTDITATRNTANIAESTNALAFRE